MSMISPTVSVIVPNFNYAKYLKERIDSILAQTYQDFELIILDDCSTDDSRDVIEKYKEDKHVTHIVYNNFNTGSPFVQWHRGIELAKGEWIWIAESDDVAKPDFLSTILMGIENCSDAVVAYSHSFLIDDESNILQSDWHDVNDDNSFIVYKGKDFAYNKLLWGCQIYNASMALFRRSAYFQMDKTYKTYHSKGDWAFWMTICLLGRVVEVRNRLSYCRLHCSSVTRNATRVGQDWEEVAVLLHSFIGQLGLKGLLLYLYRGQWTMNLRISQCTCKERIINNYPDVFGGSCFNVFFCKVFNRLKRVL